MTQRRSVATVLFTDIVGSTERAAELRDSGWRTLLEKHHTRIRREIRRHHGREIATAGDGFLATFADPDQAIRCALSIREAVRELGLEIRCGLHVAEIEERAPTVGGIAVHIGARVAAQASPGEVLVSGTLRELLTGSHFDFEDRGAHTLKGVPGEWRLFAVVGAVEGAAESASEHRPLLGRKRVLLAAALACAVIIGLVGIVLRHDLYDVIKDRGRTFSPEEAVAEAAPAIAVLPFRVNSQELDVWREGMVDLLSTNLDEVAGLRAIDSRTVLARWREQVKGGESDLATALSVARRAGARYALLGNAVSIGSDVRLTADIYDVSTGKSLWQGQVEGSPDEVLKLVDRLSVDILRAILAEGGRGVPRVDLASVTTSSVPALRAYLEGEAFLRRSDFDKGIGAFQQAVAADSTFALAHARLSTTYGWRYGLGLPAVQEHMARAARLSDRLPEREQELVRAHLALDRGSLEGIEPLKDATLKYPDDAEVWYLLGDTYFHFGQEALVTRADVDRTFSRAIELDPSFTPAYIHLIENALIEGDSSRARGLMVTYDSLAAGSSYDIYTHRNRLAYALLFGDERAREAAFAELDTVPLQTVGLLSFLLLQPPSVETLGRLMENMSRRKDLPPGANQGFVYMRRLALPMMRGRIREVIEVLQEPEMQPFAGPILYAIRAAGVAVPPAQLDQALSLPDTAGPRTHERLMGSGLQNLYAGAYAAENGRWPVHATAVRELRNYHQALLGAGDSASARFAEGLAEALEGYGTWKRGKGTEALPVLEAAQKKATHVSRDDANGTIRWWIAELLRELNRPQEAKRYYLSIWDNPLAIYRLAQLHEELGEYDEARKEYERFAALMVNVDPDPEMRVLFQDAFDAATRLKSVIRE